MFQLKTSASLAALLIVALSACGGAPTPSGGSGPLPAPSGGGSGTPIPNGLQGEWHSGAASPIGYYDPTSGAWAGASGSSFILKLAANGSYQYTGLIVVQSSGCESKVLSVESGTVTLTDDQMAWNPTSGSVQYYICDPRNVKQGTLHPSAHTWKLDTDQDGKEALTLGDPAGQARADVFYRPN